MAQLVGSNSLGLGKLIDGKNQFVHIMYSANVDGSNMTADIQADTKYIGIATNNSETAPISPSDYSWGRFVGKSGASSYTWLRYSPNEDGSNMTANPTPETKYIGVAITADNDVPTDYTEYSWALIKGDDGRGISKTEVTYQKSTSGTVIPTGTWATTIPTVNAGEYLWTRTLFTYTDNTTSSTYSVARSGVSGLGISGSDVDYQKSTSGTVAPTGGWTVTIPTVAANEYLWTRTIMTYTDDSTSISYSVGKMGADGKDAQLLYLTASSQIQAFDKDNKPKATQAITISAKLQNASGTATFVAIPYIGNTAQTAITLGGTGNDRTLLPSQWTNTQWTTIAITATLGSLTDTISVIRVKDGDTGDKGSDGIAGKDGVGIKTTEITYQLGDSGSSVPSGTWSLTVPTLVKGKYLWTRTKWTYTDNATETGYTTSYIAKDGNTGNDGIPGKDGVGISKTVIEYQGGTSGTTKPTGSWSATVPNVAQGNFLWTRTTWSYTDGTSEQGYSVSRIGIDGTDGADGLPGKDGVSIVSTTQYWVLSDSGTTQPTSGWSTSIPTFVKGKYLWTKTLWKYSDNSTEEGYVPIYISRDGSNGSDGLPGKDGVGIKSTAFAYATSAAGTTPPTSGWSATIPTIADGYYLWTRTTWTYTDDTTETGYSVAKSIKGDQGPQGLQGIQGIQGPKGDQGIKGETGADGKSSYTHIAYANSADGRTGFSVSDYTNKSYIGIYVDNTATDSTDPTKYKWTLTKGIQGDQGVPGTKGADGRTPYFHTAWADSSDGRTGFSTTVSLGKKYLGTYTDFTSADSTDPSKYKWTETSNAIEQNLAWSWSPDGTDRFTRTKPGINLLNQAWSISSTYSSDSPFWVYDAHGVSGGSLYLTTHSFYKNGNEKLYILKSPKSNSAEIFAVSKNIKVKPNTKYVFSLKGFNNSDLINFDVFFLGSRSDNGSIGGSYNFVHQIISSDKMSPSKLDSRTVSFTTSNEESYGYIRIDNNGSSSSTNSGDLYFTEMYLSEYTENPVLVPSLEDDYDNAVPRYIGRSLKDSTNPADFTWEPNPDRKPWTSYAQGLNGEGLSLMPYGEQLALLSDMVNGFTSRGITATLDRTSSIWKVSGTTNAVGDLWGFRPASKDYNGPGKYVYSLEILSGTFPVGICLQTAVYINGKWSANYKSESGNPILKFEHSSASVRDLGMYSLASGTVVDFTARVKLELANTMGISTPWTPAPTDTDENGDTGQAQLAGVPRYVGTAVLPYEDYTKYEWKVNPDWLELNTSLHLSGKLDNSSYAEDQKDVWKELNSKLTLDDETRQILEDAKSAKEATDRMKAPDGDLDKLLKEAKDADDNVRTELNGKVDSWVKTSEYVKITGDSLILGSDSNPMKLILTKKGMYIAPTGDASNEELLKSGSYFEAGTFVNNQGLVRDSSQVGQHKMKKIGNGDYTVWAYVKP